MLFTVNSRVFNDRIAFTEASAAERLVAWEIFWAKGVERMRVTLRLRCKIEKIETPMAGGESARIVNEVAAETKNHRYSNLELSGSTLKEWFSSVVE